MFDGSGTGLALFLVFIFINDFPISFFHHLLCSQTIERIFLQSFVELTRDGLHAVAPLHFSW
jgi:hypothetical protein